MFCNTIVTILVCLSTLTNSGVSKVIKTNNGLVLGVEKRYHNEDVIQFKKIPFAEPPIGNLRFRKPVPYKHWEGVLNATTFGPSCIQYLFQNDKWLLENEATSEDCLHLNIYVPQDIDKAKPKAVMVWIHGGGFVAGQGTLFDASYIALQGDVIVVTINYRLGLLGFLSTEDDNAPGNYGLWDQKIAIEWVHDNIANFGGDGNRITIFGESAGGHSVGLQTIIPSNKGYFHRAISQSGAVFGPRALASDSRRVATETGRLLNCSGNTIPELMNCLRSKPAMDILKVQSKAINGWDKTENFVSRLGPVIDGDLIVGKPTDFLKNTDSKSYKFFQSLDIMAGTNNAEGGLMYWRMMNYQESHKFNISEGIPEEVLCDVIAPTAYRSYFNSSSMMNEISEAICKQYTVTSKSLAEQGRSAVNVYADLQFVVPTVRTLKAHMNGNNISKTFHYIFAHQPSYPWIQERPPWLQGANHAGELPFVFGLEAMYPQRSIKPPSEMELSKQIMIYWSNFAKTGNPNVEEEKNDDEHIPQWPEFDANSQAYMNLTEHPHPSCRLFEDRMKFWTETIPAMLKDDVLTTTPKGTNSAFIMKCSMLALFLVCFIQIDELLSFVIEK